MTNEYICPCCEGPIDPEDVEWSCPHSLGDNTLSLYGEVTCPVCRSEWTFYEFAELSMSPSTDTLGDCSAAYAFGEEDEEEEGEED